MVLLLVDDQAMVGEAVRRTVASEPDIQFVFCSKANLAIERANQVRPSVILQDLVMPDIDGLELVRRYRANPATAETPIVVLSSEEEPRIKSDAFAQGANDYLVKLPDSIEILARIRYHARVYRMQVQRDEAMRALRSSQEELLEANRHLRSLNDQLAEANRIISELARTDTLTGLPNRRVLDEELLRQLEFSKRRKRALTAVVIDLDHFKSINDNFGHAMGDQVLRAVGACLASRVRKYDVAARYGGEEFALLLPDTLRDDGAAVAERIRASISTISIPDFPRPITASLGVATLLDGENGTELFGRADAALYRAKAGGRNRVEVDPG
ncbi:MAG: diguanylate cyclase [Polyangiaceae bacterium]|nr:diguanylate cyclase [Polyangiaceae bacterium]